MPKGASQLLVDASENGQQLTTTVCVRNAFVAPEGFVLLSADYTQLEMRLMAAFSSDAKLSEVTHLATFPG